MSVEIIHHAGVQGVDPDDRFFGSVDVVVPHPVGLDQQIARLHHHGFAVRCRVGAAAGDDEAQRGVGVTVRRGGFAGKHDLKSHRQGLAAGLQADVAPKGVGADADDFGGFHQGRIDIFPAPQPRLHALTISLVLPVAAQAQFGEFLV